MEKFSQFRDRGSGISPFIPISTPNSPLTTILSSLLFLIRLPLFLPFLLLLPISPFLPGFLRKLYLWLLLFIPGIWWVDLQLDNVKRGSLSQQPPSRVPHPGSIIAANFTSPIDAIYLAAVFDPIFVATYPGTKKVRRISLLSAIFSPLSGTIATSPPTGQGLTSLKALREKYPNHILAVFPESGTTNGKGILPLSPGLLSAPVEASVFPVSIRYTPPDITTPVPGVWVQFLWRLLGRPTHTIRVRIAEAMHNTAQATNGVPHSGSERRSSGEDDGVTIEEQHLLDNVAEALARLGRVKRVGLTLKDKKAFVAAWNKKGSR
ncbi:hypothetical protein QBC38DRAFT_61656 [Podospora fimiseda]|uniref:Phospholipid/glycerol acyltransferase domain-containing protein n=1 Tax=Podospora fimiseda TaxID=252190 RepID=A0AAN6YTP0_9PEZI|nr:hypothetical protein QBC38DRAFT_61656 [Podospora fimiseda]